MGHPLAPWHLWGNTVTLTSDTGTAGGRTHASQLCKIQYKRPETWAFFFSAHLISAVTPAPTMDVLVLIDVIIGVGRSQFNTEQAGNILTIPAFVRFDFLFTPPFPGVLPLKKYTSVGLGPPVDDNAPLVRPTIEWLVSEDIQVMARARVTGPLGSAATVEVSGYFAPRSHIRPDWFNGVDGAQFLAGETGGR